MENIRFGKPNATDDEVREAAQQANADDFIRSFPDDYNTIVGERGVTLSGGQKQRIAIARALIKNPKILILDEATSALDSESEWVVQQALDKATSDRTVLVIAHRLSTIFGADLIVVLSNGKVIECGTHSELLKNKGLYAELIHRQAKEQKVDNSFYSGTVAIWQRCEVTAAQVYRFDRLHDSGRGSFLDENIRLTGNMLIIHSHLRMRQKSCTTLDFLEK